MKPTLKRFSPRGMELLVARKRKAETRIPVGRSRYLKVAITKVEWTFEFMVQVRRLKLDETGECDQLLGLGT